MKDMRKGSYFGAPSGSKYDERFFFKKDQFIEIRVRYNKYVNEYFLDFVKNGRSMIDDDFYELKPKFDFENFNYYYGLQSINCNCDPSASNALPQNLGFEFEITGIRRYACDIYVTEASRFVCFVFLST